MTFVQGTPFVIPDTTWKLSSAMAAERPIFDYVWNYAWSKWDRWGYKWPLFREHSLWFLIQHENWVVPWLLREMIVSILVWTWYYCEYVCLIMKCEGTDIDVVVVVVVVVVLFNWVFRSSTPWLWGPTQEALLLVRKSPPRCVEVSRTLSICIKPKYIYSPS